MNHTETLDAILQAGTLPDAVITLDGTMFADPNPLSTLLVWCCGEGGATTEELEALTGLDLDALPEDLGDDGSNLVLGRLFRVWFAVARNDLAEVAGLTGREPLPGSVPAALAAALRRSAPVRTGDLREAA